jgi:serine protease AprX
MTTSLSQGRRKAVWGPRRTLAALLALAMVTVLPATGSAAPGHQQKPGKALPGTPGGHGKAPRLDDELSRRAEHSDPQATTSVIVELVPGAVVPPEFSRFVRGGNLDIINGRVLELPNKLLKKLANHPDIFRIHYDRPARLENYRTSVTVGAPIARSTFGVSGAGVGVAVIDSGIATWHDDLTVGSNTWQSYPYGNQRVAKFVDFVNGQTLPYDDNGHGSHVAGTIAGNGYDSAGEKAGIAPGASLIVLKVLDANGQGSISRLIAALNWIASNRTAYNIRVVNMSVGAGVSESYWTDPLTLAAKRLVDAGVVVVAAAGNFGKDAQGHHQYGGITAPGNAPWVLTVGASSTNGTLTRLDDTLADYSSSGPTYIDYAAKPDLVAPGTGTVSLAVPGSMFYSTKSQFLVSGSAGTAGHPYLALSGTSMATPVVSGTVALMLQANPSLTPNLVKAILQYTAQTYAGYNALQEGAGFLNSLGAVTMSRFFATAHRGDRLSVPRTWSKQIIWGNHRLKGGMITPTANAWALNIVWGTAKTMGTFGDNIVWGTALFGDNIVWGTSLFDNIVWGTSFVGDNIVWGTSLLSSDNIVWGTTLFSDDNIVWGTTLFSDDNIVWGTDCGGFDCDNIVWGTVDLDNIVWGTALVGDNIVWGTSSFLDNIVWGTSADSSTAWSSSGDEQTVFDDSATGVPPDPDNELGEAVIVPADSSTLGGE